MFEFLSLASSSAGCCYRVSGGGAQAPLLVEAGIGFDAIRRALNFQVTSLAGCLISHAHGDHARSIDKITGAGVNAYASIETWQVLSPKVRAQHRAIEIYPREQTRIGDWEVLPFEAVHDTPGTLGFVIGAPHGQRLLYLTDTAYSRFRYDGLTHIAVECNWASELIRDKVREKVVEPARARRTMQTHMSLDRLIEMLKRNDLSQVEEIHLLHLSNDNSDEAAFKSAVERATGKPVYVAAADRPREAML